MWSSAMVSPEASTARRRRFTPKRAIERGLALFSATQACSRQGSWSRGSPNQ